MIENRSPLPMFVELVGTSSKGEKTMLITAGTEVAAGQVAGGKPALIGCLRHGVPAIKFNDRRSAGGGS